MVKIGKTNTLNILTIDNTGAHLDAEHLGKVLLDTELLPPDFKSGDEIDVFLYTESDRSVVATTLIPPVQLDECAYLNVVETNQDGAFLDWGLPKDLFVPRREQQTPMQIGRSYVITVYLDDMTQRLAASSKLSFYLDEFSRDFKVGEEVDLMICGRSELGSKAIINNSTLGLLYSTEIFQKLQTGQKLKGYIKSLRADYKIDLTLQKPARALKNDLRQSILNHLKEQGGMSRITDKTAPADIYRLFEVSKSNYKRALSSLYKERKILIEKDKITLL
jgi:predicted RNA-binding protein (virulence factor B family)